MPLSCDAAEVLDDLRLAVERQAVSLTRRLNVLEDLAFRLSRAQKYRYTQIQIEFAVMDWIDINGWAPARRIAEDIGCSHTAVTKVGYWQERSHPSPKVSDVPVEIVAAHPLSLPPLQVRTPHAADTAAQDGRGAGCLVRTSKPGPRPRRCHRRGALWHSRGWWGCAFQAISVQIWWRRLAMSGRC